MTDAGRGTVHVIGAGLAGLAAATALVDAGRAVRVYEAAPRAGGRCRSYHDPVLDHVIDNGNHLLLSGNRTTLSWLASLGAEGGLAGPGAAVFPFLDLDTGRRWRLDFGRGRLPVWLLDPARRVPGAGVADHLRLFFRLMRAPDATPVGDLLPAAHPLMRAFLEPFTVAVLNRAPEKAATGFLKPVIRETLMRGGRACEPLIARHSLEEALIAPAVRRLAAHGVEIRTGRRIRALEREDGRITALRTASASIPVGAADAVLLAVPQHAARRLVPGLATPDDGEAIVNLHYRLPAPPFGEGVRLFGLVGGLAQWVFVRDDLVSVTISAADHLLDTDQERLARRIFAEIARLWSADGGRGANPPPWRVVREKRATFAAAPSALTRRPGPEAARAYARNLWLAGDWTATGLPATIEGAVRSGLAAARAIGQGTGPS
ncbi:MAG: hypothetical protein KatS3mg119_0272 [Rhodothalassiaceae bacterium]|nr:MAG: hypothetical protein KatS3mg119_0272 [Rhodothalassiaceae bacterium]